MYFKYIKSDSVEVRNSRIQGKGVFAIKRIKKGQRILEYIGERISPDEETLRYDDESMERHHTFLFAVDEHTTIDAGRIGNDAKYINHSCDPNCEAVDEEGRIFVEAIKNIQPGTELFYDYAFKQEEPLTQELIDMYPCYCGTKKCRGIILKVKKKRKPKKKTAKKRK